MDLVPYCWACTLQDVWEILQVQVVLEDLEDPDARRNQCQVVQAVLLVLGGLAQSLPLDPTIKGKSTTYHIYRISSGSGASSTKPSRGSGFWSQNLPAGLVFQVYPGALGCLQSVNRNIRRQALLSLPSLQCRHALPSAHSVGITSTVKFVLPEHGAHQQNCSVQTGLHTLNA